jgi:hypothetical protein
MFFFVYGCLCVPSPVLLVLALPEGLLWIPVLLEGSALASSSSVGGFFEVVFVGSCLTVFPVFTGML